MKIIFRFYLSVLLLTQFNITFLKAQIGINTDNPNPSSILHINSGNRGLLIPSMIKGDLVSNPADGLLIFNSNSKMFDFYNKLRSKWQPISPFTIDSIGYALSLPLKLYNTLTLNSSVFVKDSLSEIRGFGTVPVGGIIMWSGSRIPNGWALCDGHVTSEGITTPDLRGRFIVGSGQNSIGLSDPTSWDPDYLSPGNLSNKGIVKGKTGGKKAIALSINDLPPHSHIINLGTTYAGEHNHPYIITENDGAFSAYIRNGAPGRVLTHIGGYYVSYDTLTKQTVKINLPRDLGGNQMEAMPNHSHLVSGNTNTTGLGQAIENRPSYYVLAFIMRVK